MQPVQPIHEQRYICSLCDSAPGKMADGEFYPTCLHCRQKMMFGPRSEPRPPTVYEQAILRFAMAQAANSGT